MENFFSLQKRHTITEANINFYASPFVHPKRNMQQHDFIYMLSGEWKIGQNDEIFELEKDTILILGAGNTHFGVTPCPAGTKTMYFHASCEESDGICLEDSVCLPVFMHTYGNKNIKNTFAEIVNCKLRGNQRKADICFDLLLCELAESHLYTAAGGVASRIKDIIHTNPEKFFANNELAEMTNVSVKTAEAKFKTMFGITIHQYILTFKAEEAISYLKNFPEMTIKEIAYNLGFYDEYHFSKQFKKITGMSPSEYKSLLK